MPALILSPLILLAASLTIRADYRGPRWLHYLCKPLATILIGALALARALPEPRAYAAAILVGLGCSLAGDIFLMLPGDRFVAGLVSFLVAHVAYIVAFGGARSPWSAALLPPLLFYGAYVFRRLLPRLGGLRLPVLIYMLVIVAMAWQALDRWAATRDAATLAAALGALLFVASDSVLAFNRFAGRFAAAQAIILGTYFAAQWLIALSI